MVCGICAHAADKNLPARHERCESPASCSCQHLVLGTGRPETPELPAEEERQPAPALSEAQREALASTGLSLSELRGRIQNWSADGQELMAWAIVNMEAA